MLDNRDPVADADDEETEMARVAAMLRSMLELVQDIRRELAEVLELLDRAKAEGKTNSGGSEVTSRRGC